MGFAGDFMKFLKEYSVIGLAIAFVIGVTVKDLVSAVVDDVVMPVVELFLPAGEWQNAVWTFLGAEFRVGHLLAATLDFVIVALLVFLFVRYALKKEEVEKI